MTHDLIYLWGQWLADASPRRVTATTIADYQQHMRAFAQWMATELDQPFTPDAIPPIGWNAMPWRWKHRFTAISVVMQPTTSW